MTGPSDVGRLLEALEGLPPLSALTYRGCPEGVEVPVGIVVSSGLVATSLSADVAREGGQHAALFAVVGRTGRRLGDLSSRPQDEEVVLLPGTLLRAVGSVRVGDGLLAHVFEEVVTPDVVVGPGRLPTTLDELVAALEAAVSSAASGPTDAPRGRFAGPLPVVPTGRV